MMACRNGGSVSIPGSRGRVGCALLVALSIAGCGSQAATITASGGAPVGTVPAVAAVPAILPPVTSPAPTAASVIVPLAIPAAARAISQPVPLAAVDGARFEACADGTCEVSVYGPVDIAVGPDVLSVTKIGPDGLDFALSLAGGGRASGTLRSTCGTTFTLLRGGGSRGGFCAPGKVQGPPVPEPGAVSIQLAGWSSDGSAVLRLVSG